MRYVLLLLVLVLTACATRPALMATASVNSVVGLPEYPPPPPPPPPPPAPPPPPPPPQQAAPVNSRAGVTVNASRGLVRKNNKPVISSVTATDVVTEPADVSLAREPVSTSTETVDEVLSQLVLGNVAFNSPEKINIEDTVSIKVVLSPNEAEAVLLDRVDEPGTKVSESLQVSNLMEARLSGEGFKIVAVTKERQAISSGVTEWIWDVTPLAEGKRQLTLTIDALITINGEVVPKTLRTFRKPIEVEVTNTQKVSGMLNEHGKWLWSTLLVPIFGWVFKKRKDNAEKREANAIKVP